MVPRHLQGYGAQARASMHNCELVHYQPGRCVRVCVCVCVCVRVLPHAHACINGLEKARFFQIGNTEQHELVSFNARGKLWQTQSSL
jgi:hypothetical protein